MLVKNQLKKHIKHIYQFFFQFFFFNIINKSRWWVFIVFIFNIISKSMWWVLLFSFSVMLRQSYILKKKLFIQFLVYVDAHMVQYLFHQKDYDLYHQNKMQMFYYFCMEISYALLILFLYFMSKNVLIKKCIMTFILTNR